MYVSKYIECFLFLSHAKIIWHICPCACIDLTYLPCWEKKTHHKFMVIEKKQRQSLHIRITTRCFSFSSWSERLDFSEFWLSEFRMSHITENLRGPHNPTRDAQRWRLHLCSGNKKISEGTPHDIFGWIVAVFYHWNMVNLEDAILILGVCRI